MTDEYPSLARWEAQGVSMLNLRNPDDSMRESAQTRVATESGGSSLPEVGDAP
jgi:hypothetical protein